MYERPGQSQLQDTADGPGMTWIDGAIWPERAQIDDLMTALQTRRGQNSTGTSVITRVGARR